MFARMLDDNKQTNGKRNECPLDLTREVPSSCILHFKVEQSIWCQSASRIATLFRKLRKNVLHIVRLEKDFPNSKIYIQLNGESQIYRRLFTVLLSFVYPVQSLLNLVFVCLEGTKHFYSKYLLYEIKEPVLWPNPIESRWYPYYVLKFVHIRHIYITFYIVNLLYPKYRGLLGKKSIICIFR